MLPEWLTAPAATVSGIGVPSLLIQIGSALALGGGVALIYRWSHGRENDRSHVMSTTLVLLSGLIAMVSIVIGDSVARAFSLVGALSIVRFRTVVDDTRDTAFVIFAVIVGMAAGAGLVMQAAVAMPIIGAAAIILSRLSARDVVRAAGYALIIRVGLGREVESAMLQILDQHCSSAIPLASSTVRQGSALELRYDTTLRTPQSALELVRELNRLDGVLSVKLRRT
jgi:uncharacterized membrane protein YhiD involved in acid resistance